MTPHEKAKRELERLAPVAGNGLLHRRAFLRGSATLAGAMSAYRLVPSASAQKLADDPWSLAPGAAVPDYGVRSRFENKVVRTLSNPKAEPRTQHARTPHHLLNGTFTPNALHFVISHAADAPHLSRSLPLAKALDDAMIALYQNGERVLPGNGYPMRLLLPGWEGNMNIKWVRRLQVTDQPGMTFYEARTYAPILPGGKAYRFYFIQEGKSFITHPSPGLALSGPGFYEISGIAYSGNGLISKLMVSADGAHTATPSA